MMHATASSLIQYIAITYVWNLKRKGTFFPTTKGTVNSCIELVVFGISEKDENYCYLGETNFKNNEIAHAIGLVTFTNFLVSI